MPDSKPPGAARVVVIGGGILGCSVAYHLAKLGCTDVVLLERKSLTGGTTWHAAGLVGQLRGNRSLTELAKYTAELYASLEAETGQATGFRQVGSYALATSEGRLDELKRMVSMARTFGIDADMVEPGHVAAHFPGLDVSDVLGAVHIPGDAQTNPVDTTRALAAGARQHGVRICENVKVTDIRHANGTVTGVAGDFGEVEAEVVVNCAGMWAREVGGLCGVAVPLHAAEHSYVVTEPIAGLGGALPVIRDPDNCIYIKADAGKLLIGLFEPVAKPWGMAGIPDDFCFDALPDDMEHIEPYLLNAMRRLPILEDTGLQLVFNGPESFTPDDNYYIGEAAEVENVFVAAGFNSIGIQSAGGAGRMIAEWIVNGRPPLDLTPVDIRRIHPFQNNAAYLHDRTVETLGLLYAMHWPYRQPETARGARRSALHAQLEAEGACFGVVAGWERPNWYARDGIAPAYRYSYGRQNWFDCSAQEHRAARSGVALFDQSSFSKFLVQGPDAEPVLNYICANDVAVAADRVVYTQWLNDRGGIEADLTVTRLAEDRYLVVTAAATHTFVHSWLRRQTPAGARAVITDVTSGYGTVSIMGPRSRELLAAVCSSDVSNEAFGFARHRTLEIGYASVHALRTTYVGELGWELYIPTEFAPHVYERIVEHGEAFGLRHAGYHALNSLRMEKAYREWGHDIGPVDTPIEAGLDFVVAFEKQGGFCGRDALLRQRERGAQRRLVQFSLDEDAPFAYHDEPIYRDGRLVGRVTSAAFGHTVGRPVGLGYIESPDAFDPDYLHSGRFEIAVANQTYRADLSEKPLYDPKSSRVRNG